MHGVPFATFPPAVHVWLAPQVPLLTHGFVDEQLRVVSVDRQLNLQSLSQPVPGPFALPLSHSSCASTTPSPQVGATQLSFTQ